MVDLWSWQQAGADREGQKIREQTLCHGNEGYPRNSLGTKDAVWKLSGISYEKRRRMDLCRVRKTQALVYFGVEKQELRECVLHHRLRGTHQIVPVGALYTAMDLVWERKGYDPTSVPDDPVGQKGVPDGFY